MSIIALKSSDMRLSFSRRVRSMLYAALNASTTTSAKRRELSGPCVKPCIAD